MSGVFDPTSNCADAAGARTRFAAQRAKGLRAREAAQAIGLSEGAAVAAHVDAPVTGPHARQLRPDWLALLQALEPCGPLMALTRNEHVVHEKTGVYRNVSGSPKLGLALGEDIDLRFFWNRWHAGFAFVDVTAPGKPAQPSLQFFDSAGTAVHKIHVREATELAAWHGVIDQFEDAGAPAVTFRHSAPRQAGCADEAIDTDALLADWAALKDTHDFYGLLQTHRVARLQALRLANGRFTRPLAAEAVRTLLMQAAGDATPIMCFVGSGGCTQIHTGPVKRIEPMVIRGAAWLNVLDPGFNLHLREDAIDQVWMVRKPTTEGVVTSVEAYDAQGSEIAIFFGKRKPGIPELERWREIVAQLPHADERVTA